MTAIRRFAFLLYLSILLLVSGSPVGAQSSADVQYFPETGHNIRGEFLRFYKTANNPLLVFGYPITEQLTSRDGKTVQYFQRARFELHANLPEKQRVQLTPLGQTTYRSGSPQLNIDNPAACQAFQTGFRVCFAFLEFYKANDGTTQFGNPISPFEFHDNLIVQYFEKVRFEWRADRPEGQRVVLTDLGRSYFDQLGEDQAALKPIIPINATINNILSIHARAFVQKAITVANGQQTVYIVVQSQTNQAVSNVHGKATIHFSDGSTQDYFFTTNQAGLGSITFNFTNQAQGDLVPIDILVAYQGLSASTSTSFRIWV
ncbi:MAG TPA: hypothetical protein VK909_05525 [Anaerolineales bacterium]|nr:hypothetical protein [Anaerolineales bacterium]